MAGSRAMASLAVARFAKSKVISPLAGCTTASVVVILLNVFLK
jgi:hypothetical protein